MSKKLSRSKRRELRDRGELEAPRRAPVEVEHTEKRPADVIARDHEATRDEDAPPPKAAPRRDRTVLVLLSLVLAAGLIFWLLTRSPTKETKIDVPPPSAPPAASAKP